MAARGMGRASAVLFATVLVGSSLAITVGQPLAADHGCTPTPWPAFQKVAPTAKRIIVGTVTESSQAGDDRVFGQYGLNDPSDSFHLRVDEVLRGTAPENLEISRLRSGLPPRDPRPECDGLEAKIGDRIAIAFRGKLKNVPGRVTTVAWVEGDPGISGMRGKRLSIGRVRRLSGHAADGSTVPPNGGVRQPSLSLAEVSPFIGALGDDVLRAVGDAQATRVCDSILRQLPKVQVNRTPVLVGSYRMSGAELATYARRLWSMGPRVERASDGFSTPLDVCIFDGEFTEALSGRILVLARPDAPPVWGTSICDKNEIPLDYDRPDPDPWPESTENWC